MFIQHGKPTQNAFIERLNGSIRRELLNAYVFKTLSEVRYMTQNWIQDYNLNRPHKSLGYKTPLSYLKNE
jgi:putative transposase